MPIFSCRFFHILSSSHCERSGGAGGGGVVVDGRRKEVGEVGRMWTAPPPLFFFSDRKQLPFAIRSGEVGYLIPRINGPAHTSGRRWGAFGWEW